MTRGSDRATGGEGRVVRRRGGVGTHGPSLLALKHHESLPALFVVAGPYSEHTPPVRKYHDETPTQLPTGITAAHGQLRRIAARSPRCAHRIIDAVRRLVRVRQSAAAMVQAIVAHDTSTHECRIMFLLLLSNAAAYPVSGRSRVPLSRYRPRYCAANRFNLNRDMSCSVAPCVARSAMISPITLANLKPCPEQGEASDTCGHSGCRSMMK